MKVPKRLKFMMNKEETATSLIFLIYYFSFAFVYSYFSGMYFNFSKLYPFKLSSKDFSFTIPSVMHSFQN